MRERAKLYKPQVNKKEYTLSKRLFDEEIKEGEQNQPRPLPDKRFKGIDGKPIVPPNAPRGPQPQNAMNEWLSLRNNSQILLF